LLLGEKSVATSTKQTRPGKHNGLRSPDIGAVYIALNAEHPTASLQVVADLTAKYRAFRVVIR
jgi:hypothetical protein